MSNRRNLNKNVIAKIQIILVSAIALLFGNSCERKELFLRVDGVDISVEMYDVKLNLLWGVDQLDADDVLRHDPVVVSGNGGLAGPIHEREVVQIDVEERRVRAERVATRSRWITSAAGRPTG